MLVFVGSIHLPPASREEGEFSHIPVKQNQKRQDQQPVITVKKGNTNQYGYEVEIPGGCRVVYRPDRPMCGARVWIESLYDARVIDYRCN